MVTGGCGFIGAHLCAHLTQGGEDIVVVDDLSVGSRANLEALGVGAVDVQTVDIRDVESLTRLLRKSRPEKVIHLAAVHFIPLCESDPLNAIRTNVEGTQALLQACAAADSIQSVVLASSGAVYRPDTAALRETDALGPTDTYGHTKQWAEQLTQLFHSKTGIAVGIARIFNTFGPGETSSIGMRKLASRKVSRRRSSGLLEMESLLLSRQAIAAPDVGGAAVRSATGRARRSTPSTSPLRVRPIP
jgi:UDP-glucose 4-epimerase